MYSRKFRRRLNESRLLERNEETESICQITALYVCFVSRFLARDSYLSILGVVRSLSHSLELWIHSQLIGRGSVSCLSAQACSGPSRVNEVYHRLSLPLFRDLFFRLYKIFLLNALPRKRRKGDKWYVWVFHFDNLFGHVHPISARDCFPCFYATSIGVNAPTSVALSRSRAHNSDYYSLTLATDTETWGFFVFFSGFED